MKTSFHDIFPDILVDPEGWESYNLPTLTNNTIYDFEKKLFNNTHTNVVLVKNTLTGQYCLFIREIGVYNLIFKAQLKIGHINWNEWRNCLHLAEDNSIWNDYFIAETKTPFSFNVILNNEYLLKNILSDLYELLFGTLYKSILMRIDELLSDLHELNNSNEVAANVIQKFIDASKNEERNVCSTGIQLENEDINLD